jgi:hypothetical protein
MAAWGAHAAVGGCARHAILAGAAEINQETGQMRKIMITAALAAAAALAAGCSAASTSARQPAPARQQASQAANPAQIVKQAGARTSARLGSHDAYGDRMADGSFGKGDNAEAVTAYSSYDKASYDSEAARAARLADDSTGVVLIPGRLTVVIANAGAAWDDQGNIVTKWIVPPAQIAQRVHGHLLAAP